MYSITESMLDWLSGIGYSCATYPPKDMPEEFVTIERTGGDVVDLVDHPTIAVQTWAPTEARAEEMANVIRLAILTSSKPYGVHNATVNSGPYPFWDDETRCPRYQLVLDITSQLDT